GTDQTVTATDAPQRRRIVLPGAGATGAGGVPAARARPTVRRTPRRCGLGEGRPGNAALAARAPARRRGVVAPREPLRAVRIGDPPDARDLCLEQSRHRGTARSQPPPDRPPPHPADSSRLLSSARGAPGAPRHAVERPAHPDPGVAAARLAGVCLFAVARGTNAV